MAVGGGGGGIAERRKKTDGKILGVDRGPNDTCKEHQCKKQEDSCALKNCLLLSRHPHKQVYPALFRDAAPLAHPP